jgi:hypothetical protein
MISLTKGLSMKVWAGSGDSVLDQKDPGANSNECWYHSCTGKHKRRQQILKLREAAHRLVTFRTVISTTLAAWQGEILICTIPWMK